MRIIELAAVVIAVAFVVLVGYIIPTVIQLRKTVLQSERLLSQLNAELPEILNGLKETNENVRVMSSQSREAVSRASVLLNAIGDVGETVNHVHGVIRGKSTTLMRASVEWLARLSAMAGTLKNRVHKKGGAIDGE